MYSPVSLPSMLPQVQIKPWRIADSCHTVRSSQPVDCRKAVFVGGVPRPLRACELAEVMADKFGPVSFVAIDCDVDLKYPKGMYREQENRLVLSL